MSSKKPAAASSSGGTSIDASTLVNQVDGLFSDADAARATGLTNLANVRTARTYVMQRVRTDLATKLGAQAPEVAALDTTIASDTALASSLAAQGELAAKPAVTADDHETVVHGFVKDAANKGAAGVKVALAQPKGDPLATTTTAKDGHFVVRARATVKTEVPTAIELRVHDKGHPTPVELERGATGVVFTTVYLK